MVSHDELQRMFIKDTNTLNLEGVQIHRSGLNPNDVFQKSIEFSGKRTTVWLMTWAVPTDLKPTTITYIENGRLRIFEEVDTTHTFFTWFQTVWMANTHT